jgi:hypothetical protein
LNYPDDCCVSQFTLVKQIFQLISDLFHLLCFPVAHGTGLSHFDLMTLSSTANTTSTTGVPTLQKQQSSLTAKKKEIRKITANYVDFDDESLKRIAIFSCIWTIGICSSSSRSFFEQWFREYYSDEVTATRSRKIFPIFSNAPSISIFKYNLHRVEGIIPSLEWVHYESKLVSSLSSSSSVSNTIQYDLLYSDALHGMNQHSVVIVNSEMRALAYIQAALSHTIYHYLASSSSSNQVVTSSQSHSSDSFTHKQSKINRSSNGIHLFGDDYSGKKTVLHYLLQQVAYFPKGSSSSSGKSSSSHGDSSSATSSSHPSIECCRRFTLHMKKDSFFPSHSSLLQKKICKTRSKLSTYLHEHNLPEYGALFIEDINIDGQRATSLPSMNHLQHQSNQLSSDFSETLRHLTEFSSIYDYSHEKFISLPIFYTVFSSVSSAFSSSGSQSREKMNSEGFRETKQKDESSGEIDSFRNSLSYHNANKNERLLKHFYSFYCCNESIQDVFSILLVKNHYLSVNNNNSNDSMTAELASDLTYLTSSYFNNLQSVIDELQIISIKKRNGKDEKHRGRIHEKIQFFHFPENEKLLLFSIEKKHSLQWTHDVLLKLNSALSYLCSHNYSFSPNDILRIWDRIVTDIAYRFPITERITDLFSLAFEEAIDESSSGRSFVFPSFLTILERERSIRVSNVENVLTSYSPPQYDEAISYTRNCSGFYKTVQVPTITATTEKENEADEEISVVRKMTAASYYALISPVIGTAEFVRDVIFKQLVYEKTKNISSFSFSQVEHIFQKEKNNLSFWMNLLKLLNFIDLSSVLSSATSSAPFPSKESTIVMINSRHVSESSKTNLFEMTSFHLSSTGKVKEIIVNKEVLDHYVNRQVCNEDYWNEIFLSSMENFFKDPFVILSLRQFLKKYQLIKNQQIAVTRMNSFMGSSSSSSSNGGYYSSRRDSRITALPPPTKKMASNELFLSLRRKSVLHSTSPLSVSSSSSFVSPLPDESSYQKRFDELLDFIQVQLLSADPMIIPSDETPSLSPDDSASSVKHCQLTLWLLSFPCTNSCNYSTTGELQSNIFQNHGIISSILQDIKVFQSLLCHSFFDTIHESFQISLFEELRNLLYSYSISQKLILSIHEGILTSTSSDSSKMFIHEKDYLSPDSFSSLISSLPGTVYVLDLFPEKPPSLTVEAQEKEKEEAAKRRKSSISIGNNAEIKKPMSKRELKARILFVDYINSLNHFIEKNKLFDRKYCFDITNSLHLFSFIHDVISSSTSVRAAVSSSVPFASNNNTSNVLTASFLSMNTMKDSLSQIMETFHISGYNQDMVYNDHNNNVALMNLNEYQMIAIILLTLASKSVIGKIHRYHSFSSPSASSVATGKKNVYHSSLLLTTSSYDDFYSYTINLPYAVEFLMKKDIFTLSDVNSSRNDHGNSIEEGDEDEVEDKEENKTQSHSIEDHDHSSSFSLHNNPMFFQYFQLFLSNFQFSFLAYLLRHCSQLSQPSSSLLSSKYLLSSRQVLYFYYSSWNSYLSLPMNCTLKYFLPSFLTGFLFHGKILLSDSLFFPLLLLKDLLEITSTANSSHSVNVLNGQLVMEISSDFCLFSSFEKESSFFTISKLDIKIFSEIILLFLLSKGSLKIIASELTSLYEKHQSILKNNVWKELMSLIRPNHSTAETSDDDFSSDDAKEVDAKEKPSVSETSTEEKKFSANDLQKFEELFHDFSSSLFQPLECLSLLLYNISQCAKVQISGELMILFYSEFMKILFEQLSFASDFGKSSERKKKIKKSKNKKSKFDKDDYHPVYSHLSSIVGFSVLKFFLVTRGISSNYSSVGSGSLFSSLSV